MKVNVFEGYFDTAPKVSSLEEIVRLIRNDALLRDRTSKHRYYKSQGLTAEANWNASMPESVNRCRHTVWVSCSSDWVSPKANTMVSGDTW